MGLLHERGVPQAGALLEGEQHRLGALGVVHLQLLAVHLGLLPLHRVVREQRLLPVEEVQLHGRREGQGTEGHMDVHTVRGP